VVNGVKDLGELQKGANCKIILSNELNVLQIISWATLTVECLGLKPYRLLQNTPWTAKILLYTRL